MYQVVGHIVRRGMDAHATYSAGNPQPEQPAYKMPAWGVTLLAVTGIFFIGLLAMIEYTYGHLIATLSMVESPTAAIFEPIVTEDPDAPIDNNKGRAELDVYVVNQVPITAKLRTAVRHLRERAGWLSRFRGISIWVVYVIVLTRITSFFSMFPLIPMGVDAVLASVLLARLRMGWTHIAITDPSPKYWFQRLPSWGSWKKIAIPTAIFAICEQISVGLPMALWFALGLGRFNDPQKIADLSSAELQILVLKSVAVLFLGLFTTVAIVVPAVVSLTRVQASLISEEEETIVPFDRSFGGRVVPAVVGGSGVISMLEAWKTFDWNSRVRLLKLYGKVMAMQFVVFSLFVGTIIIQLQLIMGNDLKKYCHMMKKSMNN